MIAVPRLRMVYFPVNPDVGSLTPFPMVPDLAVDRAEVLGVLAYDNVGLGFTPDGAAVVSQAESASLAVTIQQGNTKRIDALPYTDLLRINNAGVWYPLAPFAVDLDKCYVRTNAALVARVNVAFTFIYRPRGN